MITDFLFSKERAGKLYELQGGITYGLGDDGRFRGVGIDEKLERVVTTGWYLTRSDGAPMFQIMGNEYIQLSDGWRESGYGYTDNKNGQKYVNTIISANKRIIAHNLFCARFADHLSADEKKTLYELQQRLTARNNSLLNDGIVSDIKTDYPAGYQRLQSYLDRFMASGGVGSLTVTIVVAAVVVASLSTAAYFAYKYYAQEAERDVRYSDELTAVLMDRLTDEEYQQLLNETQGIVTKARIKQSLSSSSGWLFTLGAVTLGGLLAYKLLKR